MPFIKWIDEPPSEDDDEIGGPHYRDPELRRRIAELKRKEKEVIRRLRAKYGTNSSRVERYLRKHGWIR